MLDLADRHRALAMLGVVRALDVDDDPYELDEVSAAIVDALDALDVDDGTRAARKPLRIPEGFEGGGRFRSVSDVVFKALKDWAEGKGPDNPFDGLKDTLDSDSAKRREQLRRAAKARGLTLRRGASENEIANALLDDVRKAKGGGGAHDVPHAPEPKAVKKAAPAKKAARKAPLTGDAALAAAPIDFTRSDSGLTPDEEAVFADYVVDGAYGTNPTLREYKGHLDPHDDQTAAEVRLMDAALSRSPLKSDVLVERGISYGAAEDVFGGEERWREDLTGATVVDHGYMSTTARPGGGTQYAEQDNEGPSPSQATIRLRVPAGTQAIKMSGSDHEDELLLQRGLTIRVISDSGYDENGGRLIEAEVVQGKVDAPAMMTGAEFDRLTPAQQRKRMADSGLSPSTIENLLGPAPDPEQSGRDQQAAIDHARRYAAAAAKFDEVVANLDGVADDDFARLRRQVDQIAQRHDIEGDLDPVTEAIDAHDLPAAQRELDRLLAAQGITRDGAAGASSRMDPKVHQPISGSIRQGAPVEVVRPGFTLTLPNDGARSVRVRDLKPGDMVPSLDPADDEPREVTHTSKASGGDLVVHYRDPRRRQGGTGAIRLEGDMEVDLGPSRDGEKVRLSKAVVEEVTPTPDPSFASVMHRDSAEGIVEQLREVKTESEAQHILAITPPHRLALVADEAGINFGADDSTEKVRDAIIQKLVTDRLRPTPGPLSDLRTLDPEATRDLAAIDVPNDKYGNAVREQLDGVTAENARERAANLRRVAKNFGDHAGMTLNNPHNQDQADRADAQIRAVAAAIQAAEILERLAGGAPQPERGNGRDYDALIDDAGLRGKSAAQLRRIADELNVTFPKGVTSVAARRKFLLDSMLDHERRTHAGMTGGATRRIREAAARLDAVDATTPPWVAGELDRIRALDPDAARDALDLHGAPDLKSLLKSAGLPVSGRKRDLVDRLVGHVHGGGTRSGDGSVSASTREGLRQSVGTGIRSSRKTSGGQMADSRIVTFGDGSKAVRKVFDFAGTGSPEARRQRDAEELASLVARAVGLDAAPAVYRDTEDSVVMSLVDGEPGRMVERDAARLAELMASGDGLRLGLLDILTGNYDRSTAWVITSGGRLAPYDNAQGWHAAQRLGPSGEVLPQQGMRPDQNPFAAAFIERRDFDNQWRANPAMPPSDLQSIRERIVQLRPEFERMGRLDWYEASLDRLDAIGGQHAPGGTPDIPDVDDDALRRELADELDADFAGEDALDLPPDQNEARLNLARVESARTIADMRAVAREYGIRIPSTKTTKRDIRSYLRSALTLRPGETIEEYRDRIRNTGHPLGNRDSRISALMAAGLSRVEAEAQVKRENDLRSLDPDQRGRILDMGRLQFADEMRAVGHDVTPGHDRLHHWWVYGEGRARWKTWTELYAHLAKIPDIGPAKAKRFASAWFHERYGYWSGSDVNRVKHGKPPRGHRVGPG